MFINSDDMFVWLLFKLLYSDLSSMYYSCKCSSMDTNGLWNYKFDSLYDTKPQRRTLKYSSSEKVYSVWNNRSIPNNLSSSVQTAIF